VGRGATLSLHLFGQVRDPGGSVNRSCDLPPARGLVRSLAGLEMRRHFRRNRRRVGCLPEGGGWGNSHASSQATEPAPSSGEICD
jgi:hypothetical protein